MINEHLFIVFGMEHYNPLGIIRTLGQSGISPVFIAVKHICRVASSSKYIGKNHFVDSVEEGFELLLQEYGDKNPKPFLIVSDDDAEELLDKNYDLLNEKFIFFNAGKPGRVTEFMDKKAILELAEKHGLRTLSAWRADKGVIPKDVEYPVITKSISPNMGGWKKDVHICRSEAELKKAYDEIQSPKVLLQKFIEKKNEYCLEGISVARGNDIFIAIASTYNYVITGYYSPYMTVKNFDKDDIGKKLETMLAEIGFEGIYEIEFLLDRDDNLYFSEINFRNSTWSYAATVAGMPLPVLWADGMLSGKIRKDAYKNIPEGFTAMVEPIDYAKRVETGQVDLAQWLMDYREASCLYYYTMDDPEPFREMMRNREKLS